MTMVLEPIAITTLGDAEKIIERGAFDVGRALIWIREGKKYLPENGGQDKTFDDYRKRRWGYSQQYCQRLMDASIVRDYLGNTPMGVLPKNERQIRPLTKIRKTNGDLDLEKIDEVWQRTTEDAPDGEITANKVSKTVDKHLKKERPRKRIPSYKKNKIDKPKPISQAIHHANTAIAHLDSIISGDPELVTAMRKVIKYANNRIKENKSQ